MPSYAKKNNSRKIDTKILEASKHPRDKEHDEILFISTLLNKLEKQTPHKEKDVKIITKEY